MLRDLEEEIILVDKDDNKVGNCGKMKAHLEGRLHRAFSVFVFNSEGELLLQKRAYNKYHSGGLWTNTCCSHPRDSEAIEEAVHRRLIEELGFDCPIKKILGLYYKAKLDNDIFEHEYDHVFIGEYNGSLEPNPDEVDDWCWINIEGLLDKLERNPNDFTYWFKLVIYDVLSFVNKARIVEI